MTLKSTAHKISFLQKKFNEDKLRQIEKKYENFLLTLENSEDKKNILNVQKTRTLMFVDILYPLTKHILWIDEGVFKNELYHFIAINYKISLESSQKINQHLISTLKKLEIFQTVDFQEGSYNFLFSYFLKVLQKKDNVSIKTELGLGLNLLNHIKTSLKSLERPSKIAFKNDLQEKFSEIIKDFTTIQKNKPWICHLKEVEEIVAYESKELNPFFKEEDYEKIIRILVKVGEHLCTSSNWNKSYQHFFSKITGSIQNAPQKLLLTLKNADVVYQSNKSCKRSKEKYWQLTEYGYQLTSSYFAHTTKEKPIISEVYIYSLPSKWQVALIQNLSTKYNQLLARSLQNQTAMFPEVVLEISKKLAQTEFKKDMVFSLFKYLKTTQTSHFKSYILKALNYFELTKDENENILKFKEKNNMLSL